GRYRLESLLGQGGMGSVWRAEHLGLKSPVAIKVLDSGVAGDDLMLSRFMREAQSAAALRSPHVVQIFDHGIDDGKAFIAMELLNGESLGDRIARVGGLPSDGALRFLTEVLRAIHKAHEAGIVHRDLKPDNIFIVKDEPEFVKVLDFGVAKVQNGDFASSGASKTQTGMMIGTPYYMSPEQTQAKDVDQRSDLWAIAIIAFEALTGKRPFTGDSFGELVIAICTSPVPIPSSVIKVPRGFDEWFVRGTQRDKARRFQSAREMADELVKIATGTTGPMRAIPSLSVPHTGPVPIAGSLPGTSSASSSTPAAEKPDQLELTTGQRSAVVSSSSRPRPVQSPALLALLGVAALIVLGVGVFVMTGGARAYRDREAAKEVEKAATPAPPAPGPVAALAPILPDPVPQQATAELPTPPASAPAPAASATAVASASQKAKATPAPAKTPARSAASAAPARPSSKDPLPPKHWDF
ncbi:MAG TPA: serine/threonine-protein kinase, partial [Polyangiaceae bacterium]